VKKREFGIILSIIMVMAVVIAIPFAVGCGGGGTEATGDTLHEGSVSSEAVVAAWVGELVEAGQETMAAADTTEVVTHSMGNTPAAVSVIADGGAATLIYTVVPGSITSTQFTVTRSGTDTADRELLWIAVK